MARAKKSQTSIDSGGYAGGRDLSESQAPVEEKVKTVPDAELLKIVAAYRTEAQEAKLDRLELNRRNWEMYYGRQDFSHKEEGQSAEVLPKVAEAVEQLCAFIKRGLTQFGDWFSVDTAPQTPLNGDQIRRLLMAYCDKIQVAPNKITNLATVITNATKQGLLEPLIILKVHGRRVDEAIFLPDGEDKRKLKRMIRKVWRPVVDIISSEDYLPDPTGRKLYEIVRTECDLVDVQDKADQGIYDKAAVAKIMEDYTKDFERDQRTPAQRNQNRSTPPSFRKRVVIEEVYGTLIDNNGNVLYRNGICAIANEKHVIRKPQPNPFWHGRSCIIAVPLIQIPHTVWGRAVFDHASSLNQAMNELFNLMLDGSIAQVWGVRQVRTDWLEDPRQVSNGIPQAATLAIKADAPLNGKVVETVTTGAVPQEAMAMFQLADREFQATSMTNDVRLGNLPPRQVKATEIVESSTASAIMIDALTADLEKELIDQLLEMMFMNLMQNADDLGADEIVDLIGVDGAFTLANMSAAQRFASFCKFTKFKANGISGTLNKVRDFQKLMALMQSVGTNPVMMQAFLERFSPQKVLSFIMKSINLDPSTMENSPEEQRMVQQRLQQMSQMAGITGAAGGQSGGVGTGGDSTESAIAQEANPSGGPGINM